MVVFYRALQLLGLRAIQGDKVLNTEPNYARHLEVALRRVRLSEHQIQEATTLEDLDVGRASLMAAQAEVQQLIRSAKREKGISLRPIAETEELHRNLREFMNKRSTTDPGTNHRRTGTDRS